MGILIVRIIMREMDDGDWGPFLNWLFSDRTVNRITFVVGAMCMILLIDMFMGLL